MVSTLNAPGGLFERIEKEAKKDFNENACENNK
jgi:hypothetical protein